MQLILFKTSSTEDPHNSVLLPQNAFLVKSSSNIFACLVLVLSFGMLTADSYSALTALSTVLLPLSLRTTVRAPANLLYLLSWFGHAQVLSPSPHQPQEGVPPFVAK